MALLGCMWNVKCECTTAEGTRRTHTHRLFTVLDSVVWNGRRFPLCPWCVIIAKFEWNTICSEFMAASSCAMQRANFFSIHICIWKIGFVCSSSSPASNGSQYIEFSAIPPLKRATSRHFRRNLNLHSTHDSGWLERHSQEFGWSGWDHLCYMCSVLRAATSMYLYLYVATSRIYLVHKRRKLRIVFSSQRRLRANNSQINYAAHVPSNAGYCNQ